MRTDDLRPSDNVEDDREASASRGGMPGGKGGLGIGAVVIIFLISWYFGIDPSVLLNGAQLLLGGGSPSQQTSPAPPVTAGTPNDPTGKFVALVLGDTEDRWTEIFAASGQTYHPPKLRLFAGSEPTPCAFARSAMGPFYCPRDQRIYLDTSFFDDLQKKFGGCSNSRACQFSEAYVIAHEVGHHVQDELGILPRVMQAQQAASSKIEANQLQVRVELQADCLAGVWANRAQQKHNFLDPGDVDQALQTASAIGD
ncbi:MAG: neutral zinc metallopeptidase, partial [Beijerinckiaceae bacterium]